MGDEIEQSQPLDLSKLFKSPTNPRLDLGDLTELSESIRNGGIIEPLIVRKRKEGEGWDVVVGERRFEAAKLAGKQKVPCIVRTLTDAQSVEIAIQENMYRKELSPMERATSLQYLLTECAEQYSSQAVLAKKLGVSEATMSDWLSILELPKEIQEQIGTEEEVKQGTKTSLSLAQTVQRLESDPKKQKEIVKKAVAEKTTVSQIEQKLEKDTEADDPKRPLYVSLDYGKLMDILDRDHPIEWDKTQRVPVPGEIVHLTMPTVERKVKAVREEDGKTIVDLEVE